MSLELLRPEIASRVKADTKALNEARAPDTESREMLKASAESIQTKAEFASARVERIRLNIDAENRALEIFEYIPLADDEQPVVYAENDQSFYVKVIAQLGGSPQDMWVNADAVAAYNPYYVQSDRVFYPISSAVTGNLGISDRVNKRVAYNFASKIDVDLWALLDSIYEAFPAGAYNLDSRILNFPTTNLLDASAQGSFNLEVFKDIFEHFLKLGGRQVRNIYVPVDAPRDIWDLQSLVSAVGASGEKDASKTVPNQVQFEIFRSGTVNNIFGYPVNIIALPTLASNYAYVTTNLPAGQYFHKPSQDKVIHIDEFQASMLNKDNQEGVQMRQTIFMLIPDPYRLNTCKIQYST